MSGDENKRVAMRLYEEVINQEAAEVIDEVFAPDVTLHDPLLNVAHGVNAFKQLLRLFDVAFPHHRVEVHQVIADGEWVSVLHTHTAEHRGKFMGLPPTGRWCVVPGIEIMRVVDGRIVEFHRHDQDIALLAQLGLVTLPVLTTA